LNFTLKIRRHEQHALLDITPADPNNSVIYAVFGFNCEQHDSLRESLIEALEVYAEYYRDLGQEEILLRELSVANQMQWYVNERERLIESQKEIEMKSFERYELAMKEYEREMEEFLEKERAWKEQARIWKNWNDLEEVKKSWAGRWGLRITAFKESGNFHKLFSLPGIDKPFLPEKPSRPLTPLRPCGLHSSQIIPSWFLCFFRIGTYFRLAIEVREEQVRMENERIEKERSREERNEKLREEEYQARRGPSQYEIELRDRENCSP
jgi:hypothetical protein